VDYAWTEELLNQIQSQDLLSIAGLVSGLLCVYFLIKQNIITWIWGILYVLISFVIFWRYQLYGDFLLHIIFLVLNIYGWYSWARGENRTESDLKVTHLTASANIGLLLISILGIWFFAQLLIVGPTWFDDMAPASLPYWDSTTSVLSVTAIWMSTRKYIENWYYWFVIDILATGIYWYKGIYFYSLLYFIYIFFAIAGFLAWNKSRQLQSNTS